MGPGALEQRAGRRHIDEGAAEFLHAVGFNGAPELGAHELLAVADAEHGDAETSTR